MKGTKTYDLSKRESFPGIKEQINLVEDSTCFPDTSIDGHQGGPRS